MSRARPALAAALLALAPALAADAPGWSRLAALPFPLAEMQAAVLNGLVYVAGGLRAGSGGDLATTNALLAYDPGVNAWRALAPMSLSLNHASLAALRGRLYVTGGVEGWGPSAEKLRAATLAYDPKANAWTRLADLPERRWGHAVAAAGGKLYVAGGLGPRAAPALEYDPAANGWRERAPIPTPRDHLSLTPVGGRLYAVGGRVSTSGGIRSLGAVEVYDPAADRWSRGRDMPTPRGGHAAALVGGRIHVAGGEEFSPSQHALAAHEAYDPEANAWARLPDLDTPTHGPASVELEGRLLVIGGITGAGAGSRFLGDLRAYRP